MNLKGKTALVTGASRGIGRAIAITLGRNGANVAVNYLKDASSASEVVSVLEQCGVQAIAVKADVRKIDEVTAMVDSTLKAFGRIDILVNNAGILKDNLLTFMKEDEWNDVIDTDLKGPFLCIKAVARQMAKQKYGKIINISSDAGLLGDMLRANYSSAKSGLDGLTRTAAREFAASGITVNAIAPGIIETDMTSGTNEQKKNKQIEMIPQHRLGRPEEIAEVALFLASDDANYITGQIISVDGGLCMRY